MAEVQNGKKSDSDHGGDSVRKDDSKGKAIKDFRKAYLKVSFFKLSFISFIQLVEEKVTGDDDASQALVSPHDIDELERVVSENLDDLVLNEIWVLERIRKQIVRPWQIRRMGIKKTCTN